MKEAYWKKVNENDPQSEYECSNCGGYAALNMYRLHVVKDEYCRNCGAKMNKEVIK